MSNRHIEVLVEQIIREGLHFVKLKELEEAYQIARERYDNPIYVDFIDPDELLQLGCFT